MPNDPLTLGPLATVDDVEARLAVALDEDQTVRVSALLADASAAVRLETGQRISEQTSTDRLFVRGSTLRLPQKPVSEIVSVVRYDDSSELSFAWDGLQTLTFAGGVLDSFEVDLVTLPNGIVVDVTYTHGYPEGQIPPYIVAITCQAAMRSYGAPVESSGVVSESLGSYSESRSVTMQEVAASGAVRLLDEEKAQLVKFGLPKLPISTL